MSNHHSMWDHFLTHTPIATIILNEHNLVMYWSNQAVDLLGWSIEDVQQKEIPFEASNTEEQTSWTRWLTNARNGIIYQSKEYYTHHKDGDSLSLRVSIASIDSPPNGLIIHLEDNSHQTQSVQNLERRVRERTRKLSATYAVLDLATSIQDPQALLEAILQRIIKATISTGGMIQLIDMKTEQLTLTAYHGVPQQIVEHIRIDSAEGGMAGWAATHEQLLLLEDISQDWRPSQIFKESSLNVFAAVPINSRGVTRGVLSVFRENKRKYTQEDTDLLWAVADQLGLTLENRTLRERTNELLVVQERNRLARELHDAVTQSLYSLTLMSTALYKGQAQLDEKNIEEISQRIQQTSQQALKEMRLLIHNLRPSALTSAGLVGALRQRLEAVEKRAGINGRLLIDDLFSVSDHIETELYFIVQEALNNALKHSRASAVTVHINNSQSHLFVTITDDGCGFDPSILKNNAGVGMSSMIERSERLGGQLTIKTDHKGTVISITIPIEETE